LFGRKREMNARGKWQGMLTIAQFNWPFYLTGVSVMILSLIGWLLLDWADLRVACAITFAAATYFLFGSLGVSHFIYDRSDLYRWGWLERALRGVNMHHAIFCHCGFDEASHALVKRFGGVQWQLLDHFDQQRMTEASIPPGARNVPPRPGNLAFSLRCLAFGRGFRRCGSCFAGHS